MCKILIVTLHYPLRILRLYIAVVCFAQHLPAFGWQRVILTVDEDYHEEALDWNLHKLLPADQRIEKVKAYSNMYADTMLKRTG
jgi:hypothetical protein